MSLEEEIVTSSASIGKAEGARVGRFVAMLSVAAIVAGVAVAVGGPPAEPAPSPWLLAALWAVTVAAGVSQVRFRLVGGIDEATTMVEVAVVPVMVLLSPAWAITVTLAALLVSETIRTPGQLQKVSYNVASQVAALAVASTVYVALVGPGFSGSAPQVLAALLAGAVLVTLNNAAFIGLIAVMTRRSMRTVVMQTGTDLVTLDFGIAATGVLAAVLAVEAPLALPLLALPTVLDRVRIRARQEAYELTTAKEAAEAANRAKSEFLSRMSHELRTPLNAILGFGQLLATDEGLDEDSRELIAPILSSGRHLLALIDEILDISRIEAGQTPINLGAVRVADVAIEAGDLVRPLADQHDITLRIEATSAEVWVSADPQRLRQILINLLSNGVKYNRPRGETTLVVRPDARSVRIEVTDTGAGIAADDLDRMFVPFERLGATGSEIQGTGLGLPISRQLVEAMGGELTVSSQEGVGSTFAVTLPAAEPEPELAPRDGSPRPPQPRSSRSR